jgi:hypothetical protein
MSKYKSVTMSADRSRRTDRWEGQHSMFFHQEQATSSGRSGTGGGDTSTAASIGPPRSILRSNSVFSLRCKLSRPRNLLRSAECG